MNASHEHGSPNVDVTGELHSDALVEWVGENEEEIAAWTQTVKMAHYYRRMLLVIAGLAFTAVSTSLAALLVGNAGAFVVEGVSYAQLLYRGMVLFASVNVGVGIVIAVREYSRRKMSTRAATMRAIQIVRDDTHGGY